MSDLLGHTIGPYHIVERLGAGGMAEVYKAFHPRLERYVALKFMRPALAAEPDFLQRFEREAKTLARLDHPHIVQIYDAGEQQGRSYLVMQYVGGGTLKDWLAARRTQGQAAELTQVVSLLQQISTALDYAHINGVIHRDIKPDNIVLAADGRALLTDFGISKLLAATTQLTEAGTIAGTPAYLAPEQARGDLDGIGPASDIYSIGVVVYELLTGRAPFSADTPLGVVLKHLNEPAPALRALRPDLPEAVEQALLKALAKDPAERFATAHAFAQALADGASTNGSPFGTTLADLGRLSMWLPRVEDETPAPGAPPFQGLQYFDAAAAERFFGRERVTARLLAQLREQRVLAVVGASGSGKSSLVRAGLVPALTHHAPLPAGTLPPTGSQHWPVHIITPTAYPLEALAERLTHTLESVSATATLMDDLGRDARSLHLYARKLVAASAQPSAEHGVLLVVDQFEELFTLCRDEDERRAFVDNLLTAVDPELGGPLRLVIALRADFYAHCGQYAGLRELLAKHQEYIGPMSAAELRQAIELPATQGGWNFEPGLVELLLRDVGDEPGGLPLLSHALLETWQRRRGRTLTFEGYTVSGGVRGAIARTAERVYEQLPPEQQTIVRALLLRLTELGEGTQDTRRRATLAELLPSGAGAATIEGVLHILADARLVTVSAEGAEVAHEALIREWPRLRGWLDEDRAGLRLQRHLTEAAQAWERVNHDADELYRGARLAQAAEWAAAHADSLNELERTFLAASEAQAQQEQAEREAQRQRELEAAQALAQEQQRRAEAERQRAEEQIRASRRLRRGAIGLAVLAVLALIAAAFAVFQQQRATIQAANAEQQARLALARQIVVHILNLAGDQRDLRLLLSAEAARRADIRETKASLLDALEWTPYAHSYLREHTSEVRSVAFSPDGKLLASGSADKTIILWDMATHQPLGAPLTGHTDWVSSVAFSPDGKLLASAGGEQVIVWDVATHQPLGAPLTGHTDWITSVAFSPDGKLLASGSYDKTVRVWDVATRQPLGTPLTGHTYWVTSVAFSPDGKMLATGSSDRTVILWDLATRRPIGAPLAGHTDGVRGIAFSPDGKLLASASDDKTVTLWDVATRRPIGAPLKDHSAAVWDVVFSPDGKTLATSSADKTVVLWDVETHQPLRRPLTGLTDPVRGIAFSPDGKTLAAGSLDKAVIVWDLATHPLHDPPLTGHTDGVWTVAFSPDGKLLASAGSDKTVRLWDVATRQPLGQPLKGHTEGVESVAFSPDGKLLASGGDDKTVRLWDVATRQPLGQPLTGHSDWVRQVAFSPDGKTLASGDCGCNADPLIILWDVATHQPLGQPLKGHTGEVDGLAFSPDGKTLASASADETVILWDVATHQPIGTPLKGHTSGVWSVAFSPDGKLLATGSNDQTVILWNVATRQPLGSPLTGHTSNVRRVAFSPDGKLLASGGYDKLVILWDVATQQPLGSLVGHTELVNDVAFSPNGKLLASAGGDGIVVLWNLDLESWQASACRIANRNLTQAEWNQFIGADIPYERTCPDLPAGTGAAPVSPTVSR